ncbi:MAG: CsbD family protein [Povalibacter sp.]|jgi:uncharacterized protein YjbJ (UPF0337 family)
MNRNQTDGAGKQVKGAIKEGVSKVTGNKSGEVEGKVEKTAGKVQSNVGNQQDANRRERERGEH